MTDKLMTKVYCSDLSSHWQYSQGGQNVRFAVVCDEGREVMLARQWRWLLDGDGFRLVGIASDVCASHGHAFFSKNPSVASLSERRIV